MFVKKGGWKMHQKQGEAEVRDVRVVEVVVTRQEMWRKDSSPQKIVVTTPK